MSFEYDMAEFIPFRDREACARVRAIRKEDILGSITWQRFIARLCAHGPVTPLVPGSILQSLPGMYTMPGGVADNLEIIIR